MGRRILDRYILACLVLDALAVLLALVSAQIFRRTLPYGLPLADRTYVNGVVFALALLCWSLSAAHFQLYSWRWIVGLRQEIGRIIASVGGFSLLFAAGLYLTFRDVPRLLFVYYAPLTLAFILLIHLLTRQFIATLPAHEAGLRIAIVGTSRVAHVLARRLAGRARRWPPISVVGFIAVARDASHEEATRRVLGDVADLERVIAAQHITTVLLALPAEDHLTALDISERLKHLAVDVRLLPDVLDLASARATIEYIEGMPLLGLRDPALSAPSRLLKYSFDRVVSAVALLALAPFMLLVALAIRLESPGPVIYRARRIGEGGKPFDMLKFRSMVDGADARLTEVFGEDGLGCGVYKVRDDPRITRVGRLIRRTSIDELPQLINVLRGEMSIVGPRPEQPFIAAQYEPWQHKRTELRPGLTGWWQVNGRSDRPLHQNTDFDLYYLENYSFWLDLLILGRTVGAIMRGRGAY